jgi:poly(A) polymerase
VLNDFSISIIRTLRDHGHKAYLVGGCVRDLLLKREPADYDVATDATPEGVMRVFPETYAVGARFGVVLVPMPEQLQIPRLARDDKSLGEGGPSHPGNKEPVSTDEATSPHGKNKIA